MFGFILRDALKRFGATVSHAGEVSVAPYAYDEVKSQDMAADNTAYNFFAPKKKNNFVITGIILKADKEVDSSIPSNVIIYEAVSAETTTVAKTLLQVPLIELEGGNYLPMNILVREGYWINGKASDTSIFGTVIGYYIPSPPN